MAGLWAARIRRFAGAASLAGAVALCSLPASAAASSGGTLKGTLQLTGSSDFVVQTSGRAHGVMATLVTAANRLAAKNYPYVWGGGHAQAGVASVGQKGPGYNGHRRGFDCSGSVAAVLAAANLWPAGAGVPGDAGVISELRAAHLIARGAGRGPVQVTLYDDPGVHIFMSVGGRVFGTSAGGSEANSKGGPGWIDGSTPDVSSHSYHRYHVLPSVLRSRVTGQSFAFHFGSLAGLAAEFQPGQPISVTYRQTAYGTLVATGIAYPGATSATGTVTSVAIDGSTVTIQLPSGSSLTLAAGTLSTLLGGLSSGDSVTVTYSNAAGTLTLRTLQVTQPALGGGGGSSGS